MRMTALRASAFMLPLLFGAFLAHAAPAPSGQGLDLVLRSINEQEAVRLEAVFDELNYAWPPAESTSGTVPPIAVSAMPVDLHTLPVQRRKTLFFRILAPMVAAENRKLLEQRKFVLDAFARFPSLPESGPVTSRLHAIARRFNVGGNLDLAKNRRALLRRVDAVPAALVLAQAANESGWGTSRFAREANNLFGMWTWDESAGLAPLRRAENATHFVRVFDDLHSAVQNYLHTINAGPAYRELRDLRETSRLRNQEPDALVLAAGLRRYSTRGDAYVDEIRSMIEYNNLRQLPGLKVKARSKEEPVRTL